MSEVHITAEARTVFGKGASRQTRRAGRVPAVLYAHGNEPVHVTLPAHELSQALRTPNVLLAVDLDGKKHLTLPKDVQRHAIKGFLVHVDLLQVKLGEKVEVGVQVHVTGTSAPGTLVNQDLDTVQVLAVATHVPETIEVSVEGLKGGAVILAKELPLPGDAELVTDGDAPVVLIAEAPRASAEDLGETAEGAEAAEGTATA